MPSSLMQSVTLKKFSSYFILHSLPFHYVCSSSITQCLSSTFHLPYRNSLTLSNWRPDGRSGLVLLRTSSTGDEQIREDMLATAAAAVTSRPAGVSRCLYEPTSDEVYPIIVEVIGLDLGGRDLRLMCANGGWTVVSLRSRAAGRGLISTSSSPFWWVCDLWGSAQSLGLLRLRGESDGDWVISVLSPASLNRGVEPVKPAGFGDFGRPGCFWNGKKLATPGGAVGGGLEALELRFRWGFTSS